jgi:serine/threonine protein kinase
VLEPTVKLMDFGLAVFYDFSAEKKPQERKKKGGATVAQVSLDGEDRSKGASENVFSVGVGTASYCAPEQRRGTGLYTSAVDMYSLGVILVEICTALGQEATESERLHLIADAKGLNMPEEMVAKFPKHARLAERLLAVDPKERPTADEVLKLWPRVNLRKGELPKTQMQFRSQHDRTQMGAAVAAAAAAGAAAAQSGTRAEVSSAAESAAVSAALDKLSIKRSMSLPEAELAAIADAVDAATNAVAGSGSPRRSPHKHRRAPSSLMSSLVLESDELVEESVGGGTSDESTSIDLETASRVDMAAEIRRLQERLAQLEGHAETT